MDFAELLKTRGRSSSSTPVVILLKIKFVALNKTMLHTAQSVESRREAL
jgi:hypothetical protein